MSDPYTTKDVIERLDQLIAIMKLSNAEKLSQYKDDIEKDAVAKAIMDLVSDEPLDYSSLIKKAASKAGKSERSAKRRIANLLDNKILVKKREGGKMLYFNSGILE